MGGRLRWPRLSRHVRLIHILRAPGAAVQGTRLDPHSVLRVFFTVRP